MKTVADTESAAGVNNRRVLMLIWAGILRGAERHVYDLVRALPSHGYAPVVCFFSSADAYGGPLAEAGIPFVELHNRSTKISVRGLIRFVRLLRSGRFDVVHDHGAPLWARLAAGMVGAPLVYTEHITRFTRLRRVGYRVVQRYTRATIAVSNAARDALIAQLAVRPETISVVPNAVDPARFESVGDVDRAAVRGELGIPAESVVLMSIGRLTRSKQFDRLIAWLTPVLLRRDAHLVIVGEGEERDALRALSADAGISARVHLIGRRLDIPRVLAASDIFVFASGEESFGIVVAEAMLAGKAVVAARLPAVAEVVADGVTGCLVDTDDGGDAFADAVEALVVDEARRSALGAAGRARALREFDPALMATRVATVYSQLLDEARR